MIGTLVLALALQSAIHAGSGGTQALSVPPASGCTSGSCTFTWSGSSGTAVTTYNSGFADLTSSKHANVITLDGAGHVQIQGFAVGGTRYTGSTSDTAEMVFTAAPSGLPNKYVGVRAPVGQEGYALRPCYNDGTGKWARICIDKGGSEFQQGPLSSYDPTVDHTAKIVVSGTSTVTIQVYWDGTLIDTGTDSSSPIAPGGNIYYGGGDGSLSAPSQQFGTLRDH